MVETGKQKNIWVDLLPAALCEIRMTPHPKSQLSSFEILMGSPFTTPQTKDNPGIHLTGDLDVIVSDYTQALIEKLRCAW